MAICCTRCGEELTAPKFHNGKPYGFACFEVVTGAKPKDKRKFVLVDEVIGGIQDGISYSPLRVAYQGRSYYLGATYKDTLGKLHNRLAVFGGSGEVFMVTHDQKGKPVWKTIP